MPMYTPMAWRSAAAALMLATAAMTMTTGSASASSTGDPWTSYHQPDIWIPAGAACSDPVHLHVVEDKERYRTDSTYPDGTPESQTWIGALHMQFIDTATGASVERALDSKGIMTFNPDGSRHTLTSENTAFGVNITPGSNLPAGLYVLSGRGTSVTYNADGTRTVALGDHGTAEPICPLISP